MQLKSRKQYGLLEKHKDYVLRARWELNLRGKVLNGRFKPSDKGGGAAVQSLRDKEGVSNKKFFSPLGLSAVWK